MIIGYDAKRLFQNSSGLGNYSRTLVEAVSGKNPDNTYLLFNSKKTNRGEDILNRDNVKFCPLPPSLAARQTKMGKIAQKNECDIFHGLSGELPFVWERKLPMPKKIVTVHDLLFLRYPQYYSFFDRKIHHKKVLNACVQADLVIAISEQTKDDIISFLQIDPFKIEVVYQPCQSIFYETFPQEELEEARLKFKLPDRYAICVGTLEPRKNCIRILKAVEKSHIPVVFIGKKTSYFNKIQAFSKKHKLEKFLYFPEVQSTEDLAKLQKGAQFAIYMSVFEGFGLPVLEALASDVPILTSNRGSMKEAAGNCGIYADPLHWEDIASKMQFLWDNPTFRKDSNSLMLKKNHLRQFSKSYFAEKMMKIYSQIYTS